MANDVQVNIKVKSDQQTLKQTSLRFTELSSVVSLAKQAFQVAKKVVEETVGEFTTYAKTVEDMARVTGSSAEEVSRLIQVSDDLQISTASLEQAMAGAVRKGIDPSVDSIASLADEYLALAPGLDRSQFLVEKFGRSGLEMAKLMEQGGDKIREMGASVDDSLIITDEAIAANQEYYAAMDDLNDIIQGVKLEFAQGLIPVLSKVAKWMEEVRKKGEESKRGFQEEAKQILDTSDSYEAYLDEMERSLNAIGESYEATLLYNDGITDMGSREEWLTDQKGALTEAVWEYVRATENGKLETIDMNEQLYNAVAASEETKDGLFDLEEQAGILAGSMDELTTRTLYNAAAANLSADAQIELAREMGLLNDESYAALSQVQYWNQQLEGGKITVEEYTENVAGLNEELRLMENPPPVIIDVEIDDEAWRNFKYEVTHFKGLIPVGAGRGGGYIPQAEGGDWIVRKPTLFLAGEAGAERATFTPLDGRHGNTTRNMTVNFYGNYGSASEIAQRLAMMEAYGV